MEVWSDVHELLSKASADQELYHFHCATGRNWWQIEALAEIRQREHLAGLDFLDREIAIVSTDKLKAAIDTMRHVTSNLRDTGVISELPEGQLPHDIDCDREGGFDVFLVTLLNVLVTAYKTGKIVVFVQPQP